MNKVQKYSIDNFPTSQELKTKPNGVYKETKKEKDGYLYTNTSYESDDKSLRYFKTEIKPI